MQRFKKFLKYYDPYKKIVIIDLICATIASLVLLVYPQLVKVITDRALVAPKEAALEIIFKVLIAFIVLIVVEYLCNYYVTYIGHVSGVKMEHDMRNDIFNHFQKLSFSYYDNQKTGQLMARITTDLFDVTELAHHGPEDIIISLVKIIGAFFILINVNWILTIVIFSVLPFMLLFSVKYNKKMKKAFKTNRERVADINAQIEDSLSGIRVVKSFANEELEIDKFSQGNNNYVESKKDSYRYMARFHSGLSGFVSFINMFVVVVGGFLIVNGKMSLGDMLSFILYSSMLVEPIRKLINFTEQFQNGATGFIRFMEILEIHPDIEDDKSAIELSRVKGRVEFKDVTFTYESDLEPVFSHLSLDVAPGDYVAVVGQSGVGKTTLLSLIPRFYEVTSGGVYVDGTDVRKIKLKSLREQVGIVQQDVYLFTGTIAENIRYGKNSATDREIIEAAKAAYAHDFIMELPEGYDTFIGQRGIKLSGGQKQRISIARVFLKNPSILIFDEATSSLDNESEKIVQESLERLAKNRTTFVIAHRLSTIENAKRIVELTDDGIVIQR